MFKIDKINLYHFPICPFCKSIRLIMNEFNVEYTSQIENFWLERDKFISINESKKVPFLLIKYYNTEIDLAKQKHNIISIFGTECIISFIIENYKTDNLIYKTEFKLNIKRNKILWFIFNIFYKNSIEIILEERIYKYYRNIKEVNFIKLQEARLNLQKDLKYFDNILLEENALISEEKDIADLVLGAFISSLDYLDEINWDKYLNLKNWYYAIKSRPSFRNILIDVIEAQKPSKNYNILDF